MSLCSTSKVPRGARRASTVAVVGAIIATTTITGEAALASSTEGLLPAQADPCPAPAAVEDLTASQELEGLTVEQGTTPEPFTATVIGVIDDGIAPGLDMIIVEASNSRAITRAGGIWAGMSGSPVYTDTGELVGAVAYGLATTSPIAGITPATEMEKLLSSGGTAAAAPKVDLTAAIERKIVASGAATAQEAAAGMRRLPLPVAVSGTNPARMQRVTRMLRRHVGNVRVYATGRAPARAAALDLVAGGNVVAAISYGATTFGAIGTVTAVCDGEALLFGHPFLFNGATSLTAHQASAVFVQPDLFVPFKVVNIGGIAGTVDQDRLAGLRVDLADTTPDTTRLHSALTSTETGELRAATTRVVLPDFVPDVAFQHTLNAVDRAYDRVGAGVVTLDWTASGKRSDDTIWRLRRHEKIASQFDASLETAFPIADVLFFLNSNPFDAITIDNVTMNGTVDPVFKAAQLVGVEKLGANGRWQPLSAETPLRLVAGSEVFLRGVLRTVRSTHVTRVQLSLVVPRLAGGTGSLRVTGGQTEFVDPTEGAEDFDDVVAALDRIPAGDTLRAQLVVDRDQQSITREARATAPTAIFGELGFDVQVVSAAGARR